jgi:hypothetical protein
LLTNLTGWPAAVVTTTGREAVDRYETLQYTAAAAHFDMGLYHRRKRLELSSQILLEKS